MLASSPINAFVRVTDPQRARHFYEKVLGLQVVSDNPFMIVFRANNALVKNGVVFERYDGMDQDELGVWKSPDGNVAWFKDPDGNILSLSEHANY